jgi:multisubunit Na+/H+ antiporter MnhF subunit
MIEDVIRVCLLVTSASMLVAIYRLLRGPSLPDRLAASDMLATCIMATIVMMGMLADTRDFTDVVMAIAVLGFFGTVTVSKYILGGRAIE